MGRRRLAPWFVPVVLLVLACPGGEEPAGVGDEVASSSDCTFSPTGDAVLDCPAPPDTFTTTDLSGTANGTAWDTWAWTSFAAYNWPALASDDFTTYPTGFVRGVPDTTKSFTDAASGDLLVWETFKEKREMFNSNADAANSWQQLTFSSKNAAQIHGGDIEFCGLVSEELKEKVGTRPRVLAQISKQGVLRAVDKPRNTLDETAEVASPAQESQDDLCDGYTDSTNPTVTDCRNYFDDPTGVSPDQPLSATQVHDRLAVGPRVFKGEPATENFVYYEVKVNYDYYDYLAENGLNDYDTAYGVAQKGEIALPHRTSSGDSGYAAANVADCYADFPGGCASGVTADALPPIGSVQVKSAWLPVDLLDGDLSDYHTTWAVYFRSLSGGGLCYTIGEFGLIGIHIIQRVHGGAAGAATEPIGGTFIFATWEHESVSTAGSFSYVNYTATDPQTGDREQTDPSPYPNTAQGLEVARLQGYPLESTQAVNRQVQAALGDDSVWSHYQLIGTQFQAISSESDSTDLGQPYYLANLVIETNRGLQQFQGQPPNVATIDKYMSSTGPGGSLFDPSANNVSFGNGEQTPSGYDMGGCMGCHGIAQAQGYAFSFVLQDGDKGTTPDTADDVTIPPIPPSSSD